MILADTSVWIHHFRSDDPALRTMLVEGRVLSHPFVVGELALGDLRPRGPILRELESLPATVRADEEEVLTLIEAERLYASGIGYVDAHLLASMRLTPGATLWTRDRRLQAAAARLGLAAAPG